MTEIHRKQCYRLDIDGQVHCLTFSCFQRQPFLTHDRCCKWMAMALQEGRQKGLYDLWAYVFMPVITTTDSGNEGADMTETYGASETSTRR